MLALSSQLWKLTPANGPHTHRTQNTGSRLGFGGFVLIHTSGGRSLLKDQDIL